MSTSKFSTSEINCSRFFLLTFRKKSCDTCGNVWKEEETDKLAENESSEEMIRKKKKSAEKKINGTPQASIKDKIYFSWFISLNYEDGRTK